MKLFLLLVLILSGCQTYREVETNSGTLKVYKSGYISGAKKYVVNGCAIDATIFEEALKAERLLPDVVWIRKLIVGFRNEGVDGAHIWVLFMFPPGQNQLWAWDKRGGVRVRAYINNPPQIARQLLPKLVITHAFYLEDEES